MKLTRTVTLHNLDHVHKYALLIFWCQYTLAGDGFYVVFNYIRDVCVNAYWFFTKPMGIKNLYKVRITSEPQLRGIK